MRLFITVLTFYITSCGSIIVAQDYGEIINGHYISGIMSRNNDNYCPLVCKSSGNFDYDNVDDSSTIVYISKSETLIGFYDTSVKYAFLLDWNTQQFLIINANSETSAIFSLSNGKGYYLTRSIKATMIYSASGSIDSVIKYFKSVTTLKEVFKMYAQYGESFSFTENKLGHQVESIIKGFVNALLFEQEDYLNGVEKWTSFAHSVYAYFTDYLRSPGVYEIHESGKGIMQNLLQYKGELNLNHGLAQNFLHTLNQLGSSNSNNFHDTRLIQMLQHAHIDHSTQLLGFLRFIELLSAINVTAAYNANSEAKLSEFLLPDSRFTVQNFEKILQSNPELQRLLHIFIQANGGRQNWTSRFNSTNWRQLLNNIPGFHQFIQFLTDNRSAFGSFLEMGETFANAIRDVSKNISELSNSGPIPNPLEPVIGGFAGGIGGAANQGSNMLHLFDGQS